ncbi:hypothetical protein AB0C07_34885 [Actinoplanes missouriensis]|uniref:hypothetical protein n=1 Tax=Actinoplanes missouriensis TaxID=1866 RepID=UPI0034119990
MTTSDWPQADPRLERAYRRLLRAYPRDYRRRHGAEVVTTLLEMATPDQRRPGAADAWHLVGSGIRQRFRLPAGRPLAALAALLVALIGGAFGAASGSWAVQQAFLPVPDTATSAALHRQVAGDPEAALTRSTVDPAVSPWGLDDVGWGSGAAEWDVEAARARLAADGWALHPVSPFPPAGVSAHEEDAPTITGWSFEADRDGVLLRTTGFVVGSDGVTPAEATVMTRASAAGSAALTPAVLLGGVAGLLTGWLVAAAATRRIRRLPRARARSAALSGATAILLLGVPTVALYGNVIRVFQYSGQVSTVHSALKAGPYWPFGPVWLNLALTLIGAALAAAALATSRGRPVPTPHWTEEPA